MNNSRRTAFIVGVLFIITFVTAIAGRLLYGPVLDDPNYIVSAGADTQIAFGALFELLLIIANVGTALWLFPILKRQHEAFSLSYVAARLLENTFIAIGIVSLLGILTLRQEGADAGSLVPVGESLVAMNNWTFLLGPGFVVGIGNGLILGYLMFRSGLVPRGMALLGSSGDPWPPLRGSPCCWVSSSKAPRRKASRRSRRFSGKRRSACTSPSRGSGHLRFSPAISELPEWAPRSHVVGEPLRPPSS